MRPEESDARLAEKEGLTLRHYRMRRLKNRLIALAILIAVGVAVWLANMR